MWSVLATSPDFKQKDWSCHKLTSQSNAPCGQLQPHHQGFAQQDQSCRKLTSQSAAPCGQLQPHHQGFAQQDLQCSFREERPLGRGWRSFASSPLHAVIRTPITLLLVQGQRATRKRELNCRLYFLSSLINACQGRLFLSLTWDISNFAWLMMTFELYSFDDLWQFFFFF